MTDSPIDEIKSRLNVTDVLAEYIQLRKAGVNFKAVCPFHSEKTPSFVISPVKQIWHCFGCGLGGDIFEFIKLIENVEFAQALRILADRAGVELKKPTASEQQFMSKANQLSDINADAAVYFQKVMWDSNAGKEALEYLRGRGLNDVTIKKWQLGYAPNDFHYLENFLSKKYQKPQIVEAGLIIRRDDGTYFDRFHDRVMFTIVNYFGDVVGFTGRLLHEKKDAGKYVNSPETPIYNKSRVIFGLYFAKSTIKKENRAIIVEGNMDVITAHQAGFTQTVATSGTAFTLDQLRELFKLTNNLVFALDSDSAGFTATQKVLDLALSLGFNVKIVEMGEAKDPDELIKKGPGIWKKAIDGALHYIDWELKQSQKQFDPATPEGVDGIQKRIIRLISYVGNPVVRSHFIRKLSETLNVSEKSITEELNKLGQPLIEAVEKEAVKKKSRKEILEEQLLGLSINLKTTEFFSDLEPEDFSEANRELMRGLRVEARTDQDHLKKTFPNLAARIDLLVFSAQVETEQQQLNPQEEIKRVSHELVKLIIKKKMEVVADRMARAEQAKDKQQISELTGEFTALSSRMSKIP